MDQLADVVEERPGTRSRLAVGVAIVVAVVVGGGGVAAGFLGSTDTATAGEARVSVAWGPHSALVTATADLAEVVAAVDGNPMRFDGLAAPCVEVVGAATTLWITTATGDGTRLDRPGDAALAEDADPVPSLSACPVDGEPSTTVAP